MRVIMNAAEIFYAIKGNSNKPILAKRKDKSEDDARKNYNFNFPKRIIKVTMLDEKSL